MCYFGNPLSESLHPDSTHFDWIGSRSKNLYSHHGIMKIINKIHTFMLSMRECNIFGMEHRNEFQYFDHIVSAWAKCQGGVFLYFYLGSIFLSTDLYKYSKFRWSYLQFYRIILKCTFYYKIELFWNAHFITKVQTKCGERCCKKRCR